MSKLVRSTSNKMVGGVCAGIADAYGYDVTLVRIITAALVPVSYTHLTLPTKA